MWTSQQKLKDMKISDVMLQVKSIYFCQKMKEANNFSVSNNWLNRWEEIHQMTICREKLSADFETVNQFCIRFNGKGKPH